MVKFNQIKMSKISGLKGIYNKNQAMAIVIGLIWVMAFLIYLNYFQTSTLATMAFILLLTFIVFQNPETGIHLIIFGIMIFERWFGLEPLTVFGLTMKIYPLDIVIIITLVAAVFRSNNNKLRINKKIILPLIIFFLAVIFWAVASRFFWGGQQALILSAIKNFIFYPLTIIFIAVYYIRNREQWLRIINTFLISAMFIVIFIILGIVLGRGLWSDYTPLSTSGVRLLAATHAFFLLLPLYILTCLIIYNRNFLQKWDLIFIFCWLTGLFISLFRNLWIGMTSGIFLIFVFVKNQQRFRFLTVFLKIFILAIVCLIIVTWLSYLTYGDNSFVMPYLDSFKERILAVNPLSITDDSAKFRLAAWKEARDRLVARPFLGIGFGQNLQFGLENNEYEIAVRELHNDYLAVVIQMGIIGFLFFSYLLISIIKISYQNFKDGDYEMKPYLLSLFIFLITFLILSALGTYWETNFFLVYFWLCLGLVMTAKNFENSHNIKAHG